ncbi:MAG: hypothetical protein LBU89_07765, partial [Fibromonadaceae bacterium]|nr:hypothetical protein [Fibromonadaceae bacterium]
MAKLVVYLRVENCELRIMQHQVFNCANIFASADNSAPITREMQSGKGILHSQFYNSQLAKSFNYVAAP